MAQIFLSYSRTDHLIARRVAEALQLEGFDVWWDQTLQAGDAYDKVTENALRSAKAVVVLWSKTSVDSRWVRAEATLADRNKTLVPAMIEPCERPIMFELTQTADLAHWKGDAQDSAWQALVADVRRFVDGTADASVLGPATPRVTRRRAWYSRRATWMIAAAALLVGVAATLFLVSQGDEPSASAALSRSNDDVSVAVLPFVNMSSDKEQEYFSDGLSEELLNQLAQIKDLRVAGRTSSFSFKGRNQDLRLIGEQLGVSNILEGSVRKDGDRLRVTAQLIDARNGSHLWSDTFDRELKGVFEIQEEIAMAVSGALSVALDVGEMSRARGGTTNLEAYDKYLRARGVAMGSGIRAPVEAANLYREATTLDPQFVSAWRELHETLAQQIIYVPGAAAAARKEMGEVVARMVALAPDAWQTRAIRAIQLADAHEWLASENEGLAAMRTMPSTHITDTRFRVWLLYAVGRQREAVTLLEKVRLVDPLSLAVSYQLQVAYHAAERIEDAQREYERSKSLSGDRSLVEGVAAMRLSSKGYEKQTPAEREAVVRQMRTDVAQSIAAFYVELADQLADRRRALEVVRREIEDPATSNATFLVIAAHFADYLGDRDLTLKAFRRAYLELGGANVGFLWKPSPTSIRVDPEFKAIVREMKLVDYWRATGNWGESCRPRGEQDFECT